MVSMATIFSKYLYYSTTNTLMHNMSMFHILLLNEKNKISIGIFLGGGDGGGGGVIP